jgi:hypothetical protein
MERHLQTTYFDIKYKVQAAGTAATSPPQVPKGLEYGVRLLKQLADHS